MNPNFKGPQRRKSNDGISSSTQRFFPGIRPGLYAAIMGDPYVEVRVKREAKAAKDAAKTARAAARDAAKGKGYFQEDYVLECRRLSEQVRLTTGQICRALEKRGYPCRPSSVSAHLKYTNRQNLHPAPNAKSYLPATNPGVSVGFCPSDQTSLPQLLNPFKGDF